IVLTRRHRRRGTSQLAPWLPAATAENEELAETMARIIGAQDPSRETLVLSPAALTRRLGSVERDRIAELLSNRTTAELKGAAELHPLAMAELDAEQKTPFKRW